MTPKKPQYSPHKHRPIDYGATQKIVQPNDISPPLNEKGIKRVQGIVVSLLYVGRSVNNKLLVALSAIGAQQAGATLKRPYLVILIKNFYKVRVPPTTKVLQLKGLFNKAYTRYTVSLVVGDEELVVIGNVELFFVVD